MYNLKDEHQNNNFSNLEDGNDNGNNVSHDETVEDEYEDFNYELKNDICNRENQWYLCFSYIIIYKIGF